jgi:stage II sporulation protein D
MISAGAVEVNRVIQSGLGLTEKALCLPANLKNSVDSGYGFGYFTRANDFVELGYTNETKISILKTQNIFLQNGVLL